VDVDEDRTLAIVVDAGCPDVEVKAVFGVERVRLVERSEGGAAFAVVDGLRGLWAERVSVTNACPRGWRCGRGEASGRGVGTVGDAFEDVDVLIEDAANFAEGCCGDGDADRTGAEVFREEIGDAE
jgi:hypothetical protein